MTLLATIESEDTDTVLPLIPARRASSMVGSVTPVGRLSFDFDIHGQSKLSPNLSKTSNSRRTSLLAKRRMSVRPERELVTQFLAKDGINQHDIQRAFQLLSTDGQKITASDIQRFGSKYFDKIPDLAVKQKDEITKEQLNTLLLRKELSSLPFEKAFEWFQPTNGMIPRAVMARISKGASTHETVLKKDISAVTRKFDVDADGQINLEDFKRIGVTL